MGIAIANRKNCCDCCALRDTQTNIYLGVRKKVCLIIISKRFPIGIGIGNFYVADSEAISDVFSEKVLQDSFPHFSGVGPGRGICVVLPNFWAA